MRAVLIGDVAIGLDHRPFVIAEMSGNHNQSLERALRIVDMAAEAGAHALKLQTYTAESLTLDLRTPDFMIDDPKSLWHGSSLFDLYKAAYTPWEWHEPIMKRARERGMIAFSSPFDESAVDFLESLDVPAYKIASFENTHHPLIRKAAGTGKPLVISTGMATLAEIHEAVDVARSAGCRDVILLKCTSSYPASPRDSNVVTVGHLRQLFGCEVGLSDHTLGIGAAVAAVAHGATVIEKHFTLDRADGGLDSAFSLEPEELRMLVEETARAWESVGTVSYGPAACETTSQQERRSLYVVQDMRAGDVFTPDQLRCIRPSFGLPPRFYDVVLGKRVTRDVKRGTPVDWSLILRS